MRRAGRRAENRDVPAVAADRIDTLKQRLKHGGCHSERMAAHRRETFERIFAETRGRPQVVRTAEALAAFLREKDIVVFEEDVLAGFQQGYDFTVPMDLACFDEHPADITGERFCPLARAAGVEGADAELIEDYCTAVRIGLLGTCLGGHVIAGYDRVLEQGFGGLIDAARRRLDAGADFARGSLVVCEAARDYALRYADKAAALAESTGDDDCRRRLGRMAEACRWISARPPRSFLEAVQLVALTHEIITAEQPSGSLSLGRLDQYLFPYYRRDLDAGRLTQAEAEELVQALWLKFGALKGGFQNVTLGGIDADGRYAANDLTVMGLRASLRLKMDQPLVSLRWHPSMPDGLWEPVLDLIREGLGFPAMFNDDVVVDAKCRVGVERADAVDYGIVGCVEMNAPGKEWAQTEAVRLNWAKVLELTLNDGRCTVTGRQTRLRPRRPLASLTTFEEFVDCFKQVFTEAIDFAARGTVLRDQGFGLVYPYPFLSSTMDGCLEAGRDVTAGGTTYNLLTMNNCGMADTADSLMAVKRLVYERRSVTLPELADALRSNFDGAERLRSELADAAPRFGNDLDEPDALVKELTELLHERTRRHRNARGGGFQIGMYTVAAHAHLGAATGALPSGRPAKVALANGFSPCQGADAAGPTAVVKSLTKVDHRRFGNGMVLDLKFSPSFFEEPQSREALRALIETYFKLGGLEIQFNVVSRETLLAAQADPDAYRDLVVRVSGFSAYFVDLAKVCQDEIIARTEHGREERSRP